MHTGTNARQTTVCSARTDAVMHTGKLPGECRLPPHILSFGCQLFAIRHTLLMQADLMQGDGNSTGSGNPAGYCYNEQPNWSAYREPSFGHGTLDIVNSTTALWSAIPMPVIACLPVRMTMCLSLCLLVSGRLSVCLSVSLGLFVH